MTCLVQTTQSVIGATCSSPCRQCPGEIPRSEPGRRAVRGVARAEKWLPVLLCEVWKLA